MPIKGYYKIASVRSPVLLSRRFLGIKSLVFSKVWIGVKNPYEVMPERAKYFEKKNLQQKCAKNRVFLNLIEKFNN